MCVTCCVLQNSSVLLNDKLTIVDHKRMFYVKKAFVNEVSYQLIENELRFLLVISFLLMKISQMSC